MTAICIRLDAFTDSHIADLRTLYLHAGWISAQEDPTSWMTQLPHRSTCFAVVMIEGHIVASGRTISDGMSDGYIQDVVTHPDHRKHGYASQIIQLLLRDLQRRNVDWIGLIAEPGSEALYQRLGFAPLKQMTPMRWQGDTHE